MVKVAILHIKRLPEGVYLATSDDIPGLVVQGKTIVETIKNARTNAIDLYEARKELGWNTPQLNTIAPSFDYPLILE